VNPGQGPPDFASAAAQLGVAEKELITEIGIPPGDPKRTGGNSYSNRTEWGRGISCPINSGLLKELLMISKESTCCAPLKCCSHHGSEISGLVDCLSAYQGHIYRLGQCQFLHSQLRGVVRPHHQVGEFACFQRPQHMFLMPGICAFNGVRA